jgi:Lar family restriction alleviation protein
MTELLPCPFCGGKAAFQPRTALSYEVACVVCGASGPTFPLPRYTTQADWLARLRERAVTHWNTRPE